MRDYIVTTISAGYGKETFRVCAESAFAAVEKIRSQQEAKYRVVFSSSVREIL